jgi:DNA polymerase III alpha subunit
LGTGVDAHPLELVADRIAKGNALTTVEAAAKVGQRVRVAGMRQTWRRTGTPYGDYIYFMALEDLDGVLDVVITGDVYRRHRNELTGPGPYVIEGVLELDGVTEEPTIRAEKIWKI